MRRWLDCLMSMHKMSGTSFGDAMIKFTTRKLMGPSCMEEKNACKHWVFYAIKLLYLHNK